MDGCHIKKRKWLWEKGYVGNDIWAGYMVQEKFMALELKDPDTILDTPSRGLASGNVRNLSKSVSSCLK